MTGVTAAWPMFRGERGNTGSCDFAHPVEMPTVKWKKRIGSMVYASPLAGSAVLVQAIGEGGAYIGAYGFEDGATLWQHELTFFPSPHWVTGYLDGEELVFTDYRNIVVLDVKTGLVVKSKGLADGWAAVSAPVCVSHRILVAGNDSTLYALSRESLDVLWTFKADGGVIYSSPATDGERVFFATCGMRTGTLYAVDLLTGEQVWKESMPEDGEVLRHSATVADGRVFVQAGVDGASTRAFDSTTGRGLWGRRLEPAGGPAAMPLHNVGSSPAYRTGHLYANTLGGSVHCVSASDGEPVYSLRVAEMIESAPVVTETAVYCIGSDGTVCAIEASDGTARWSIELAEGVVGSPCVTTDEICIGTTVGSLVCLAW